MIKVSKSARIHPDVEMYDGEGEIYIGDNCNIKKGVVINCYGGIVRIGHNVSVGEYSVLYGHGGIIIEDNVAVAPHCVLSAQKHIYPSTVPLRYSGEMLGLIMLHSDCIVSAHVTITESVSIGRGSLVGAGSVVTSDVPESVFACGIPCRVIRSHERNRLYGFRGSEGPSNVCID